MERSIKVEDGVETENPNMDALKAFAKMKSKSQVSIEKQSSGKDTSPVEGSFDGGPTWDMKTAKMGESSPEPKPMEQKKANFDYSSSENEKAYTSPGSDGIRMESSANHDYAKPEKSSNFSPKASSETGSTKAAPILTKQDVERFISQKQKKDALGL